MSSDVSAVCFSLPCGAHTSSSFDHRRAAQASRVNVTPPTSRRSSASAHPPTGGAGATVAAQGGGRGGVDAGARAARCRKGTKTKQNYRSSLSGTLIFNFVCAEPTLMQLGTAGRKGSPMRCASVQKLLPGRRRYPMSERIA